MKPVVDEKALFPCPFCGASAHYLRRAIGIRGTLGYDWWHSIQCNSCNAAVGYDDNRYRNKDDASKAWNTRAHAPQPDLHKLIGQMEGLKHEDTVGFRQTNNAIDRCIALVKAWC